MDEYRKFLFKNPELWIAPGLSTWLNLTKNEVLERVTLELKHPSSTTQNMAERLGWLIGERPSFKVEDYTTKERLLADLGYLLWCIYL